MTARSMGTAHPVAATSVEERASRVAEAAHELRRKVVQMAAGRGEGYVGQGLGAADILAAVYFGGHLRFDPARPDWPERDRFLLSTGHYSIVLWAALAHAGVLAENELETYGQDGSRLEMSTLESTPGVEVTGGSLAHGLSVAIGIGLGHRLAGRPAKVFNLLSDGELQEGSTWEAAMFAGHHKLDTLIALVDVNRTQADGDLGQVLEVEPIAQKFEAFGWLALDVDGNDVHALLTALDAVTTTNGRPKVVVCHTLLGCGVPLIMNRERAHFVRVHAHEWDLVRAQLDEAQP